MKLNINWQVISKMGSDHCRNEDVVYCDEDETFCIIGLADGQSGKQFSVKGGAACLKTASDYIRKKGVQDFLHRMYVDEVGYEIVNEIRKTLQVLSSEYQRPKEEFASTLLLLVIDRESGDYIFVHLGDGCLIRLPPKENPEMLSFPENGITARYTWLTTSEQALFHTRIQFGNIKNLQRLYLLSDGMSCLCKGKNITRLGKMFFGSGDQDRLAAVIDLEAPADDATCITVSWQ